MKFIQVLLPIISHLSDIVIKDYHEKTRHGGVSESLTRLKVRTWILRARQRIMSYLDLHLFRCNLCEKLRVKPGTQMPAPLPADRINQTYVYPFQVTSQDYLGPFTLKITMILRKPTFCSSHVL